MVRPSLRIKTPRFDHVQWNSFSHAIIILSITHHCGLVHFRLFEVVSIAWLKTRISSDAENFTSRKLLPLKTYRSTRYFLVSKVSQSVTIFNATNMNECFSSVIHVCIFSLAQQIDEREKIALWAGKGVEIWNNEKLPLLCALIMLDSNAQREHRRPMILNRNISLKKVNQTLFSKWYSPQCYKFCKPGLYARRNRDGF